MKPGDLVTYKGARLPMPTFHGEVAGRAIQFNDQTGTLRLFPNDRVRVVELRGDNFALVSHAALKGGQVMLAPVHALAAIADETSHNGEDAAL